MFTEKEIKNMKFISSSKWMYFGYFCLFFGAVASLFLSVQYFILSQKYAHLINKNMSEIFNGLLEGFSPRKTYDGAYCAAIYILIISVKHFFTAIIALLTILFIRIRAKLSLKIINLIESKGKLGTTP